MRSLLSSIALLSACQGSPPVKAPGDVVLNSQCMAHPDNPYRFGLPDEPTGGAPSAAAPSAAPMEEDMAMDDAVDIATQPAPVPRAEQEQLTLPPSPEVVTPGRPDPVKPTPPKRRKRSSTASKPPISDTASKTTSNRGPSSRPGAPAKPVPTPRLGFEQRPRVRRDWGPAFYLSNDDSMSLASAQRLLWSLTHNAPLDPAEIRPHELLSWFAFRTANPVNDEMFGVVASAERIGDEDLSMALAVQAKTTPRQPLDLTLVVDRSEAMAIEGRMHLTRTALSAMQGRLIDGDRVDLVVYDATPCTAVTDWTAGRDDPALLTAMVSGVRPSRGADLNGALHEGMRLATSRFTEGRNRRIMLFSGGELSEGDVRIDTTEGLGRALDQFGVRLTAVGVGREASDIVLDRLTEHGKGGYVYLGSLDAVPRVFVDGFDQLVQTVAHDVRLKLTLPDSLALHRFYGEESSKVRSEVEAVHWASGASQLFLQDLKVHSGRLSADDAVKVDIEYRDATSREVRVQHLETTVGQMFGTEVANVRKARALITWSESVRHVALGHPCDAAAQQFRKLMAETGGDSELILLRQHLDRICPPGSRDDGLTTLSIQLPEGKISRVAAQCNNRFRQAKLQPGQNVVHLRVPPGPCTLTTDHPWVQGRVEVAAAGTRTRCVVQGKELDCR